MIAFFSFVGLVLLWIIIYYIPFGFWFIARVSGVNISLMELTRMKWKKVPPDIIVMALLLGSKAGLNTDADMWKNHYIKGGNVNDTANGLVAAKQAGIELDFNTAAALDLTGYDIMELVKQARETGSTKLTIPAKNNDK